MKIAANGEPREIAAATPRRGAGRARLRPARVATARERRLRARPAARRPRARSDGDRLEVARPDAGRLTMQQLLRRRALRSRLCSARRNIPRPRPGRGVPGRGRRGRHRLAAPRVRRQPRRRGLLGDDPRASACGCCRTPPAATRVKEAVTTAQMAREVFGTPLDQARGDRPRRHAAARRRSAGRGRAHPRRRRLPGLPLHHRGSGRRASACSMPAARC